MNLNKWLKIAAAAIVVAPELIQAGKQTVGAVKSVVKKPSADSIQAVEQAVMPIAGAAGFAFKANSPQTPSVGA